MPTDHLPLTTRVSRRIGGMICRLRGHHFFYPGGEVNSWSAYSCVRCNTLSRAIEDLPNAPGPDDDHYDDNHYFDDDWQDRIEREWALAKRWVPWLPWPRWS